MMSDNELLLALSNLLDKKLKAELQPIKSEQARINMIIENEIRNDIKLLTESYLPSAKRYEKASTKIEVMQTDIDVMKKVITEHSEKLQQLA